MKNTLNEDLRKSGFQPAFCRSSFQGVLDELEEYFNYYVYDGKQYVLLQLSHSRQVPNPFPLDGKGALVRVKELMKSSMIRTMPFVNAES